MNPLVSILLFWLPWLSALHRLSGPVDSANFVDALVVTQTPSADTACLFLGPYVPSVVTFPAMHGLGARGPHSFDDAYFAYCELDLPVLSFLRIRVVLYELAVVPTH